MDRFCSPNMYNLAESLRYSRKRGIAQHRCYFSQGRDFEKRLDLIQRLAVRGIANAQAVVGERVVVVVVGGYIDVAIIEIVVREIPVSGTIVSRKARMVSSRSTDVLSKPIPCVRI